MNTDFRSYDKVYYVESDNPQSSRSPIAIQPQLDLFQVIWDTNTSSKETTIAIKTLEIDSKKITHFHELPNLAPRTIKILSTSGEIISLTLLTLQIFTEHVKTKVAGERNLNFTSDQEVQDYYLNTNFKSY